MADEMASKHEGMTREQLRRQAEARLRLSRRDVAAMPLRSVQQLVHELQVHQIELEMQNEELRRTQIELEVARDLYAELYDFAPTGYLTLNRQGKIVAANLRACMLLNVNRKDLLTQSVARFIAPEDADLFHRHCQDVLHAGTTQACQVRLQDKSGAVRWIHFESLAVGEKAGRITHWRSTMLEITTRKHAEEQLVASHLQLRSLTARLESIREEERIRIAREIHDELGQELTGVKLELSLLRDQLPEGSRPLKAKLTAISTLIDSTIHSIQRIATDLRPVVLDQLGLIPAIEWQAHEFQSRTGIRCTLDICLRSVTLSLAGSTTMFRIFQEVLTNVNRHAQASAVTITIQEQAGHLILEVRDNGRGVTDAELSDPHSLGLVGMRERALLLGGEMTFIGSRGTGTTVRAKIPLDQPSSP